MRLGITKFKFYAFQDHRSRTRVERIDIPGDEREHLRCITDGLRVGIASTRQDVSIVRGRFRDNRRLCSSLDRDKFHTRPEPVDEHYRQLGA